MVEWKRDMVLEEDSVVDSPMALQHRGDAVVDIWLDSRVTKKPLDERVAIQC